jgi:hypothetical protein
VVGVRTPALALLLAGACAAPEDGDFSVRETTVVVDSTAPFAVQADLPARMESTLEVALRYWGGSWNDLAGFTVTLTDADRVDCRGVSSALGCTDGRRIRVVTSDPGTGVLDCVEQTVLVHEVGHAVIGDPMHLDRRWMAFDAVAEALADRPGYARSGETRCDLCVSAWRHPAGR